MRALEPEPADRTIGAEEFAGIVKEHVDVGAGWLELGSLLDQWKGLLERAVKRAPGAEATSTEPSDKAVHTLRYEEVALAFDDDPSPDGPTVEAHALPSDAALLAALPLAEQVHVATASSPLPPPAWSEAALPAAPQGPAGGTKAHGVGSSWRSFWIPALVFTAFAAVAVAAGLLATYVH
jgi:hypothetical protein